VSNAYQQQGQGCVCEFRNLSQTLRDVIIKAASSPRYVVTVCCLENGNLPWIWGPFLSREDANEWIEEHRQRIAGLHWVDMDSLGITELSREW